MPAKRAEPKLYLLDTSAVLAFLKGEPGVATVKEILRSARQGRSRVTVSLMTMYEVLYVTTSELGKEEGARRTAELGNLPLEKLPLTEPVALCAAHLKASYAISVADSWIAATAATIGATLVHKDPELGALAEEVQVEALPFKG